MVSIGYFLSCEEFGPRELVRQARLAEDAGFERLWISDHFHPWNGQQGHSPFVWSVIGALSEVTSLPVTTAVTCPTVRMHPAIVAQAAATAAVQCRGGFTLGVGSGEALNEHVLGDHWPPAGVRLSMLEESVELIRALHRGDEVSYHGEHYTVENARIYTLPEQPVPIYVSAFGPKSAKLAGRIGDGFMSTIPDSELISTFRESGGGDLPAQAGFKVCWADTEIEGARTAHRLWPNEHLPGELAQVLPTPRHFEQASELVTEDTVREAVPCGPDPEKHVAALRKYVDAGYDEVYVQQIGPNQDAFFKAWAAHVLPRFEHAGSERS
ncbi:TIGR03557 family F420-dependent LLM class oxidoreductase [Allokutzneria sp. A3M-2-11 16]|uniref:TIGR03557 family F420-dependent LLM class oxidoreductase n=1 Tax=Allokutzneria sp. A3M-2-11 16 TaxID=2962043 RepID=UPI0020B7E884|nr:TIGR03557 family F420-dependent LLM class oxidoreductase [Allokutzneria sp. A3M-2-11 16]MCP3801594.1 TIGR03557 family F420-dependent LLM class oxidoreductase [Allokutzneria sp. A3M-2-11 16]